MSSKVGAIQPISISLHRAQRSALSKVTKCSTCAQFVFRPVSPRDIPRYLLSADLYVSATTIESFGMAVLEAASYALPVITTRVGYAAKMVTEGAGYTVPPDDEDSLVEAMARMLDDPKELRAAGWRMRRHVEQLGLTWHESARKIAELYRMLISRPDGPENVRSDGPA